MPNPMPDKIRDPTFVRKFWSQVDTSDPGVCWVKMTGHDRSRYGSVQVNRVRLQAQRVAYAISTGIDPGDLVVRHSCDNPPCRNPAHLLTGTQGDNAADRIARGRHHRLPNGRNHTATTRVVPFRLDPELADRLADHAAQQGTSVSVVLRSLVDDLLSTPALHDAPM